MIYVIENDKGREYDEDLLVFVGIEDFGTNFDDLDYAIDVARKLIARGHEVIVQRVGGTYAQERHTVWG